MPVNKTVALAGCRGAAGAVVQEEPGVQGRIRRAEKPEEQQDESSFERDVFKLSWWRGPGSGEWGKKLTAVNK